MLYHLKRRGFVFAFASLPILIALLGSAKAEAEAKAKTQSEVFDSLLLGTSYDKRERPTPNGPGEPVEVRTSLFVYFLGHIEEERLEYETHLRVQHRWVDPRLHFRNANLSRDDLFRYEQLEGEAWAADRIWTPNIFVENEQSSEIMELVRKNVFVKIQKHGLVQHSYRISSKLLCNMDLRRFPHDRQHCLLKFESWTLHTDELLLTWEENRPMVMNMFLLPEYEITGFTTTANVSCYSDVFPAPRMAGVVPAPETTTATSLSKSASASTASDSADVSMACALAPGTPGSRSFSTITVHFVLDRLVGHYISAYYVPSILLVVMSWVAFWLDPNAVPGRTTLGTATWLTFITLTHNTGNTNLPKVNYIKFLDIWFLGCTLFIFASLLEFAFVNTIWRRKETIEVKSFTAKNILPAAASVFASPAVSRKTSTHSLSAEPRKVRRRSTSLLETGTTYTSPKRKITTKSIDGLSIPEPPDESKREVVTFSISVPDITVLNGKTSSDKRSARESDSILLPINSEDGLSIEENNNQAKDGSSTPHENGHIALHFSNPVDMFKSMSCEEIALWIDHKARIFFPVLFLVFNIFYWCFALGVDCNFRTECPPNRRNLWEN